MSKREMMLVLGCGPMGEIFAAALARNEAQAQRRSR
jgi:threonine dehydrogenase-like Zn-dependent dehydrogenase